MPSYGVRGCMVFSKIFRQNHFDLIFLYFDRAIQVVYTLKFLERLDEYFLRNTDFSKKCIFHCFIVFFENLACDLRTTMHYMKKLRYPKDAASNSGCSKRNTFFIFSNTSKKKPLYICIGS